MKKNFICLAVFAAHCLNVCAMELSQSDKTLESESKALFNAINELDLPKIGELINEQTAHVVQDGAIPLDEILITAMALQSATDNQQSNKDAARIALNVIMASTNAHAFKEAHMVGLINLGGPELQQILKVRPDLLNYDNANVLLTRAICCGNEQAVKLLIQCNPDVYVKNRRSLSTVMRMPEWRQGQWTCKSTLLIKEPAKAVYATRIALRSIITKIDCAQFYIEDLEHFINLGWYEELSFILQKRVDLVNAKFAKGYGQMTLLEYALFRNDHKAVALLLRFRADIYQRSTQIPTGQPKTLYQMGIVSPNKWIRQYFAEAAIRRYFGYV